MRTVAAVLALVACVHAGMWALLRPEGKAPDFTGQLASISYSPFADSSHPDTGTRPTAEQIRADLKTIPITQHRSDKRIERCACGRFERQKPGDQRRHDRLRGATCAVFAFDRDAETLFG